MTAASILRDLVAFSIQAAIVVVIVAVLVRHVAIPARARYVLLRLALLACLVAPWALRSTVVISSPLPVVEPTAVAALTFSSNVTESGPRAVASAEPPRTVPPLPWTALAIAALLTGVAARGLWLAVGVLRLRRLTRLAVPIHIDDCVEIQEQLGTRATIAQVTGLAQPVTFGVRRPIVLLPETLADASPALRRAVVTHELLHVRRRDWVSVLGEEAVRTALWFHPAILWLIAHIQLVREELVDELTVRATGDRRSYMQALLRFADSSGLRPLDWARGGPAPAFAHRRQLFHRIVRVSKEKVMSAPRIAISVAALVAALAATSWYASMLFPIVAAVHVDVVPSSPISSIEQSLTGLPVTSRLVPEQRPAEQGRGGTAAPNTPYAVTPENPIPRRTRGVSPMWPSAFAGRQLDVVVGARLTIDGEGAVTSVARAGCSVSTAGDPEDTVCRAFFDATAAAIRQWRYERPAQAPLQFAITVTFRPGAAATIEQFISAEERLRYVRETQNSLRVLAEQTGGIAVTDVSAAGARVPTTEFLRDQLGRVTAQLRELERAYRLAIERGPANADLLRAQRQLEVLNAEVNRIAAELRSDLVSRATPLEEARAVLEQLRQLESQVTTLKTDQTGREAAATVLPTPTTAFDGSRPLVSPSGRAPIRVGGVFPDRMPVPTKQVQPVYTPELMRARIQGTVPVEVLVDETGKVADARVLRSVPLLDDAALAAAKQWEFTPTLLNGEPVPVLLMLEMNFRLR